MEYVSANPTGPMHVGHCRGAVVGDALANLLTKAGWAVTKEYYINDAGAQVQALAWAAYWRYLQALGTTLTEEEFAPTIPGGLQYRGDYLVPVGEALARAASATPWPRAPCLPIPRCGSTRSAAYGRRDDGRDPRGPRGRSASARRLRQRGRAGARRCC